MRPDKQLAEGLRALGLDHGAETVGAFMAYLAELKKWNRVHNLTALRTDREIVLKHFLDSALYLSVLPQEVAWVADVGSGAGFPGIPIKLLRPALRVTLIEPGSKKAAFLRHMMRVLKLKDVQCVQQRVQDVTAVQADAVLTRATFSVADFMERASHVLGPGGLFVLSKGPKASAETEGMGPELKVVPLGIPMSDITRNMIVVRKPLDKQQ